MKVDAPGKLVLSGAYAVLRGAPAIVTAVNRRVVADTARAASFLAPEVTEGIRLLGKRGPVLSPPDYDVSELRGDGHKWGLGSSAAICVASLGALLLEQKRERGEAIEREDVLRELYPLARQAHRLAQGGGSGIDVAASCYGGTLIARLADEKQKEAPPAIEETCLPPGLCVEVFGVTESASTADFVRRVFSLEETAPADFRVHLDALRAESRRAEDACKSGNASEFVSALRAQGATLKELGELARVPIVLPKIASLWTTLESESAFLPSGAGGGDVNIYVGPHPSSRPFRQKAKQLGLISLPLEVGAPGVRWQL